MMETCSKCKFWDMLKKPRNGTGEAHGLCGQAVEHGDDKDAMIVQDGSMYLAELYTRGDHGCKEFKEKT